MYIASRSFVFATKYTHFEVKLSGGQFSMAAYCELLAAFFGLFLKVIVLFTLLSTNEVLMGNPGLGLP